MKIKFDENLVSIVIPVYNREKFIGETIQSALNQNYQNIEIIISDNKSTDNTFKIIKKFFNKNNKVRIYQNKENIGPVKNWKKCLELANGKFCKILWSDDLISSNFISSALSNFNSEIAFVFSATEIFYETGEKKTFYEHQFDQNQISTQDFIKGLILRTSYLPVSPGCALFRTEDLKNNLILDIPNDDNLDFKNFGAGNDMLLFLSTCLKYKTIQYIPSVESYFRHHANSITCSQNVSIYYDWARLHFILSNKMNFLLKDFYDWLLKNKTNDPIYFNFIKTVNKLII